MTPVSSSPNFKESRRPNSSSPKTQDQNVKLKETELGYHYELKIPGYIKDDFRFYISKNELVVTTEKSKANTKTKTSDNSKHSYCYPSALFKMEIPLPKYPIQKKITAEYINEVLYFTLYKGEG